MTGAGLGRACCRACPWRWLPTRRSGSLAMSGGGGGTDRSCSEGASGVGQTPERGHLLSPDDLSIQCRNEKNIR